MTAQAHKDVGYFHRCNAWDLFRVNDEYWEIQKVDESSGVYARDREAMEHVKSCGSCLQALGHKLLTASPDGQWGIP
jgi:hypothetical protein